MFGLILATALLQGSPCPSVYCYPKIPVIAEVEPLAEESGFSEFLVTFPSPVQTGLPANDRVAAFYFLPRTPGPYPALPILHALGSEKARLEKWVGRKFAQRGFAALLLVLPHHMMRRADGGLWDAIRRGDADAILATGQQAVLDLRRALDWFDGRDEIAHDRMAVLGISLGAMVAAVALGVEDRLKAGVLILGGGDPAHLVWSSFLARRFRRRLERQGLTQEVLRQRWAPIDPLSFAGGARGKALYMVNARWDCVIPRHSVERLWQALGRPKIDWLPGGHYTTFLFAPWILSWAHRFLQDHLEGRPLEMPAKARAPVKKVPDSIYAPTP
ncbi:MAG: hypothetical protein ABSD47_13640 [Candidatus Methylomirabilota bacterium]|jgi:hypothetical protein